MNLVWGFRLTASKISALFPRCGFAKLSFCQEKWQWKRCCSFPVHFLCNQMACLDPRNATSKNNIPKPVSIWKPQRCVWSSPSDPHSSQIRMYSEVADGQVSWPVLISAPSCFCLKVCAMLIPGHILVMLWTMLCFLLLLNVRHSDL